jgi:hypothetical protein
MLFLGMATALACSSKKVRASFSKEDSKGNFFKLSDIDDSINNIHFYYDILSLKS